MTALVPRLSYDKAAEIALHAYHHGTSLQEAALSLGAVSAEEFARLVDPALMLGPGASDAGAAGGAGGAPDGGAAAGSC